MIHILPKIVSLLNKHINSGQTNLGKQVGLRAATGSIVQLDYEKEEVLIHYDAQSERLRTYPCAKEPDTIDWIHKYIQPRDVIFDVGANVGVYSLIAAKYLKKDVTIFAFEPAWFNFMQLNRNVLLNQLETCIFPVGIALSDQDGVGWFNYSSKEYGSALHALWKPVNEFGEPFLPVSKQPVATFTLDNFVAYLNMQVPNHIKIDVDGLEAKVLSGASATLKNPAVRSMIIELNTSAQEDQRAITELLHNGFRIVNTLDKLEAKRQRLGDQVLEQEKWAKYRNLVNYTFVRV